MNARSTSTSCSATCARCVHRRPELKIIITSATIDTEAFSAAFDGAPVIQVSGRTFPVDVVYAPLDGWARLCRGIPTNPTRRPSAVGLGGEALHYVDGTAEAIERIVAR
jgi:ATP-dependent helicase HrpA